MFDKPADFPKIICLCGSTKFKDEFEYANAEFTLAGFIVLSVGFFSHYEKKINSAISHLFDRIKPQLDELHKRKIDLADEIFIINVNEYIGYSTRSEIEYATLKKKPISYWQTSHIAQSYYWLKLKL